MESNLMSHRSKSSFQSEVGAEAIMFRIGKELDKEALEVLLMSHPECVVVDTIMAQLKDVVKLENPTKKLSEEEYKSLIDKKLEGKNQDEYGVWVYYPWRNTLVHILDEEEFVRVRTIRNAYKITLEEQQSLATKKIGVIGLSVGQSVAMTLAMERVAGEIRIADFDSLELSNMNRLRTGVQHIGVLKATIVKREIAEIDPYIKVTIYDQGITRENIHRFLEHDGKLDLVVEECDNSDIKLLVRKKCKPLGIPVLMELSDRGVLDVERYDLDTSYPILHGLLDQDLLDSDVLDDSQKQKLLFQCMDINEISERGKSSLMEVGKTITTWPQLGSDVALGGAVVTMTARMILLNQPVKSSRTYVDVPSIISK